MSLRVPVATAPPCIVVFATRERVRSAARAAFPRRRARLIMGRTAAELAREFPSFPFFAITPMRGTDGPAVARCAALEFTDIVVDGVDDEALRDLVLPSTFSTRFFDAL